jgi:hypothetical protein
MRWGHTRHNKLLSFVHIDGFGINSQHDLLSQNLCHRRDTKLPQSVTRSDQLGITITFTTTIDTITRKEKNKTNSWTTIKEKRK